MIVDQKRWQRWVMQTATRWEDICDIVQETGIERIDREHQRLVEYILDMGRLTRSSKNLRMNSQTLEEQNKLFNRFVKTLHQHFLTEEYFIDRYSLPDIGHQRRQHSAFLDTINAIRSDFQDGLVSTFQHSRVEVIEELINHINNVDVDTFTLKNFQPHIKKALHWHDVSEIIKTTGLPTVDTEHKQLTEQIIAINTFLTRCNYTIDSEQSRAELLTFFDEMYRVTKHHFDNEEQLLEQYDLPTDKQCGEHGKFMRALSGQRELVAGNKKTDLSGFMDFLFLWWINHINGIDYKEFHFSRIAGPVFNKAKSSDDFQWLIRKTGIVEVDEEHANLIGLLLNLNKPQQKGDQPIDLKTELSKIAKFAASHFSHEEKIMEQEGIKDMVAHIEAHKMLLQYIGEAMGHLVSGRSQISPIFLKRLMRWWVEHTNGMDYDTFVTNRERT
ncbi:hemerythrin domain-containing protein [Desulforhopalus sp. 52FAK]